ncbi:MAG: DUF2634 domain-containing protein [Angelakisella sp.]
MNIFPEAMSAISNTSSELPLCVEVPWQEGKPVFKNGSPVTVSGHAAVMAWCAKALATERYLYEIYTKNYGCEMAALVGKPYSDELKKAEAARYVRESLEINPYVVDVSGITVDFDENTLMVGCEIKTIYGTGRMEVKNNV